MSREPTSVFRSGAQPMDSFASPEIVNGPIVPCRRQVNDSVPDETDQEEK